jgi:hypothetical protein
MSEAKAVFRGVQMLIAAGMEAMILGSWRTIAPLLRDLRVQSGPLHSHNVERNYGTARLVR